MAISDTERNDLHNWLVSAAGPDRAATLMAYLPPAGWADVVRRSDLDGALAALKSEMHAEFSSARSEISSLRAEFKTDLTAMTRNLYLGMAAILAAYSSVIVGLVR